MRPSAEARSVIRRGNPPYLADSPSLQQTCAVYTVVEAADSIQDIKLVRSGTHDATCEGPTLSGVVFRIVEGEERPLKNR